MPDPWSRVVLVSVSPEIDGGRWPIARAVGEWVEVEAGVIVDGHEKVAVELRYALGDEAPQAAALKLRWNDEYVGRFQVERLGTYRYQVQAWLDEFGTWQDLFRRRVDGGVVQAELEAELIDGARLLKHAAEAAPADVHTVLDLYVKRFEAGEAEAALEEALAPLVRAHAPRERLVESRWLTVRVDPERARFAAWYEFFPRSAADPNPDGTARHGTLDDAASRLARIAELGFDVVYLPPIHPVGVQYRKGKDNAPTARPGEPGSPWAIGGDGGGHKAVAKELGGMEAFERFVTEADRVGLQVALDIAFQTSPDHPYVQEHPDWFRHRPDGTIRYAENPPKKYQDVYPLDFESRDAVALWNELRSVFTFWIDRGIRIFRVDNPHTKPFAFWEWCLGSLRAEHPDLIFLAEAFARPKTMYTLAKLGFNNSYTYFTWRNTKEELEQYGQDLFETEVAEFYRPSFWPNTPDIFTEYLDHGGRPAHVARLVLAGTLSSVYGLYGPPYEHVVGNKHPLREEYANNEKYEVQSWNWNDPASLQPLMRRLNRIRRENPALHLMRNLQFVTTDNPHLIAYTKETDDNLILTVVNLDPFNTQAGHVTLPLHELEIREDQPFEVHDLLGGARYHWNGSSNYVELNPESLPAHIFRIARHPRTEADFPVIA